MVKSECYPIRTRTKEAPYPFRIVRHIFNQYIPNSEQYSLLNTYFVFIKNFVLQNSIEFEVYINILYKNEDMGHDQYTDQHL